MAAADLVQWNGWAFSFQTASQRMMARPAPRAGQMHPDGDEVLFLIRGRVDVVLGENGAQRTVEMAPEHTVLVPEGMCAGRRANSSE
jgi:mannose-6-phosphate isomerase-like protein (cupin superfamily)